MELKELKMLFHAGNLTGVCIVIYPMTIEWAIQVSRRSDTPVYMSSQRSDVRLFKSLDAVFKAVRELGFKKATLDAS
jgi:hypothetical protein